MSEEELERELRVALARVEPAKDFSVQRYSRGYRRMALAAGLAIALLAPAGVSWYRHRRAEQARDQVVTALRITQSKLEKTRQMVARGLNRRNNL